MFFLIDEEPSLRSTPVNVIAGGLVLKRFFRLTDDELAEAIHLVVRLEHALHLTNMKVAPVSDKTFSHFRELLLEREHEKGDNLLKDCVRVRPRT